MDLLDPLFKFLTNEIPSDDEVHTQMKTIVWATIDNKSREIITAHNDDTLLNTGMASVRGHLFSQAIQAKVFVGFHSGEDPVIVNIDDVINLTIIGNKGLELALKHNMKPLLIKGDKEETHCNLKHFIQGKVKTMDTIQRFVLAIDLI